MLEGAAGLRVAAGCRVVPLFLVTLAGASRQEVPAVTCWDCMPYRSTGRLHEPSTTPALLPPARVLQGPPEWHPAPEPLQRAAAEAAQAAAAHGADLPKLALMEAVKNTAIASTLVGICTRQQVSGVTGNAVTQTAITGNAAPKTDVTGYAVTSIDVTGNAVTSIDVTGNAVTKTDVTGNAAPNIDITGNAVTSIDVT